MTETFALCDLALGVASRHVVTVQHRLDELPTSLLRKLMPLLDAFHLERLENTFLRRGVSTESVWKDHWTKLVGWNSEECESNNGCWRQRYMEAFFHNALYNPNHQHHLLSITKESFLTAFLTASCYINSLILRHDLSVVARLTSISQGEFVLARLTTCVRRVQFRHLRCGEVQFSPDLHCLLKALAYNGILQEVSIAQCPNANPSLLQAIFTACGCGFKETTTPEPVEDSGGIFVEDSDSNSETTPAEGKSWSEVVDCNSSNTDAFGDLFDFVFTQTVTQETVPSEEYASRLLYCLGLSTAGEEFNQPNGCHFKCHRDSGKLAFEIPELKLSHVSILELSHVGFTDETCHLLEMVLLRWFSLKSLILTYNALTDDQLLVVLHGVVHLCRHPTNHFDSLTIAESPLPLPSLSLAVPVLVAQPQLRKLDIGIDFLPGIIHMPPIHQLCPFTCALSLQCLKLCLLHHPVNASLLQALLLRASQYLQELQLSGLDTALPTDLGLVLSAIPDGLHNLALTRVDLTSSLGLLSDCLHRLSSLQHLDLGHCNIGIGHMDKLWILVQELRGLRALKQLALSGNRLGDEGLLMLAELFLHDSLCFLTHLDVSLNCIHSDGLQKFATNLPVTHTSLLLLDITGNPISPSASPTLAALATLRRHVRCVRSNVWSAESPLVDHVAAM
uniref:leucine-rich repeat-containing protein 41 isoform X1 n=2 Tax=Myxine glutinosa TaxID=7769 RepID=UPI00358FAFA1